MLRSSQPQRFVAGMDRGQSALLPECHDDWVDKSNPVRVVDAFVNALDLAGLGFEGMEPTVTGRPSYHPSVLLKLYIYGYINQVQSSRRLEREAGRNLEVMWLLGRLVPDDKVIAGSRKDNGPPSGEWYLFLLARAASRLPFWGRTRRYFSAFGFFGSRLLLFCPFAIVCLPVRVQNSHIVLGAANLKRAAIKPMFQEGS